MVEQYLSLCVFKLVKNIFQTAVLRGGQRGMIIRGYCPIELNREFNTMVYLRGILIYREDKKSYWPKISEAVVCHKLNPFIEQ